MIERFRKVEFELEVLYNAWKNVRGKKDEAVIGFRYEGL